MEFKTFITVFFTMALLIMCCSELYAQQTDTLHNKISAQAAPQKNFVMPPLIRRRENPGYGYAFNLLNIRPLFLNEERRSGSPLLVSNLFPGSDLNTKFLAYQLPYGTTPAAPGIIRQPSLSETLAGALLNPHQNSVTGSKGVLSNAISSISTAKPNQLPVPIANFKGLLGIPVNGNPPGQPGSNLTGAVNPLSINSLSIPGIPMNSNLSNQPASTISSAANLLHINPLPQLINTSLLPGVLPANFNLLSNNLPAGGGSKLVNQLQGSFLNFNGIPGVPVKGNPLNQPASTLTSAVNLLNVKSLRQLNNTSLVPAILPANINLLSNNINAVKTQLNSEASRLLNVRQALTGQALSSFKSINDAVGDNFKSLHHPSFSANLSLENDLQYNPISLIPNGSKFQEVAGIRGSLLIVGIPLNINISNNQAAFNGRDFLRGSLYKFGFNPTALSGLLRNQLQQYAQLKNTIFNGFNFTDYVHKTITEQVHSLQSTVASEKNAPFAHLLEDPNQLQALITLSETQLKTKLRSLAAEKNKIPTDSAGKKLMLTDVEKLANLKRADSLIAVITTIKKQLAAKGLDPARLILQENYLTGKTSTTFNSSEAVLALVDKKPANGLQSVFTGLKDLRIGSFGTTLPGATNGQQSKLMNGANLTVKLGYYPLTFGFGTLNDINSLKDANYQSSVYVHPQSLTYIGADMPRSVFGNVNVSVISSFSGQSNNAQYAIPTLPGNAVAVTVTKSMNMDNLGHLSVDVSKSATLFSNDYQPGNDAILLKKAGANYNLSNNLFQSFSVGFRHNLNIKDINASDNVYFNYSGLGYQNPANNGYSGSSMKFGGALKKSFYKNKLLFDFRTDYSSTPLSYTNNDKFKNYQVQFDSKYQVTNQFNLSLKYLASGTSESAQGGTNSVYNAQKFQLDGNKSYKIGQYFAISRVSIADQSFKNTYASTTGSNLLNFTYVQSLVFKTTSITGIFFYNKELSTSQLLGDMLTSDVTYQYQFFKMLQLSSGLTYLSNSSYAKQIGVKQSINLLAKKHFDITGSVNFMKNLITAQYADLYPSCRGELTLKYYFKTD